MQNIFPAFHSDFCFSPFSSHYVWKTRSMLRLTEDRVLMGIFGPKRNEVTRQWKEVQFGEDFHSLFVKQCVRN
jgi:hypothetical protein